MPVITSPTSKAIRWLSLLCVIFSFCACNNSSADEGVSVEIKRYKLEILVSDKLGGKNTDPLPEDFIKLAQPIYIYGKEPRAYLLDADSRIIGMAWEQKPNLQVFIEKPCTGTQVSSENCTNNVISTSVTSKLKRIEIADFASNKELKDSLILVNIDAHIRASTANNTKIYVVSGSNRASQSLRVDSNVFFNHIDSLKTRIQEDVGGGIYNFIVIYNPPTEKNDLKQSSVTIKAKAKKGIEVVKVRPKDKEYMYDDGSISTGFKRPLGKNIIEWSQELTNAADKIELKFVVKGTDLKYQYEVTEKTSYVFNPGNREVPMHKTAVTIIATYKGKRIPTRGPTLLPNETFNCSD